MADVARWIEVEGCRNFRDVGGYATAGGGRVRCRRLYRSDQLRGVSASACGRLRTDLGVRTVIDLRRPHERDGAAAILAEQGIRCVSISLNRQDETIEAPEPVGMDLGPVYMWIAEGARPAVKEAIELLMDEATYPAVVHCQGGKDRTGILSALVLSMVGVCDEDIVADYALTEEARGRQSPEALAAAFQYVREQGLPEAVLSAQPESMATFLDILRERYGSATGFASACGVAADAPDRLRDLLVAGGSPGEHTAGRRPG